MLTNQTNGKTVAVITRHNVSNYGSVLQSYATERALRQLGHRPIVVDYQRFDETLFGSVKRYSAGKPLTHRLYRKTLWAVLCGVGRHRFRKEREQLLTLSGHCDESDLWKVVPNADVYLTGSDQVWNKMGDGSVDGAFFWEGLRKREDQRLVSYAASFGGDELVGGYEQRISKWLAEYDAISVREDSGVKLVERCGQHATQVLDPTFLLTAEDWLELAGDASAPSRPYALVYNLHPDSDMLSYVREKASGSGLGLISVCPTFRRRIGKQVVLPSIATFLALIRNAACVYTDSFHGTSFCINLGVPFVAVFPKENAARNHSVLRLFGLEGRSWDVFEGNAWDDDIDWVEVRHVLEAERIRSIAWLESALEGDA